jgi:hypothetical protein
MHPLMTAKLAQQLVDERVREARPRRQDDVRAERPRCRHTRQRRLVALSLLLIDRDSQR